MNPRENWKAPVRKTVISPGENPLVHELVTRGVTSAIARSLLKDHDERYIAEKLEIFDYLICQHSQMVSKNAPGFLRTSIEKDFAPPSGFISNADRQRKKQEEEAARQRQRELEIAEETAKLNQKSQTDALWDSLADEDKAQVESEALKRMNSFALKIYNQEKVNGTVSSGHHTLRVEIERLLLERLKHTVPADASVVTSALN
jgi:hypothetical protein